MSDGETTWHDTDAVVWKNTSAAVWIPPHAQVVTVTDGIVFGDTEQISIGITETDGIVFGETLGPTDLTTSMTDGIVFGDTYQVAFLMALSDGIVFADSPIYPLETSEHDIYREVFAVTFGYTALAKTGITSNSNFSALPILFNFRAFPVYPVVN
ncbi:MAG: hypothetical protein ACYTE8_00505 [Planctomycetota bacterium]|jgi:hypothetical protein